MVECDLAKVDVAGSNPVSRSTTSRPIHCLASFAVRLKPVVEGNGVRASNDESISWARSLAILAAISRWLWTSVNASVDES